MMDFARLTGLSSSKEKPRRYLWTDAFAVCNFLTLYKQTSDERYKDLALRLVDQVHNILGRRRDEGMGGGALAMHLGRLVSVLAGLVLTAATYGLGRAMWPRRR